MQANSMDARLIHKVFESQVAAAPNQIAIKFNEQDVSYQQLNASANCLAGYLCSEGVKHGDIVAISMQRSIGMIATMLAILKCGAAFLPLDNQSPVKRNLLLLNESQVKVVVSDQPGDGIQSNHRQWINITELPVFAVADTPNFDLPGDVEDKAYVMYTSGSTGGPKGVMVPHRAIHRLVINTNYIEFKPADKLLHVSSPGFDASTFEIWGALLNGATLVLYPEKTLDPNLFAAVIKQHKVTILFLTPALFHLVAVRFSAAFNAVNTVVIGGDIISPKVINHLIDDHNDITLINGYGPTENTTFTTAHRMTIANRPGSSVPIGKPITGTVIHVLDDELQPVKPGKVGELFASGAGVALGYVDAGKNKNAFITNKSIADGLIYRTGDLVFENLDGDLEFVGRKDNQVKVRGFRISLEEVQVSLLELEDVVEAAVVVNKHESGDQQLVAYLNTRDGKSPKASEIKQELALSLPGYMIPDRIHLDVKMHVSENGKINKKVLIG